jgi:hypothetical protein
MHILTITRTFLKIHGDNNMDVISFKAWRVWFYVDENGRNVIRTWLENIGASPSDRAALQALIDICEFSGPDALSYCTLELGNGFYAFKSKHEGGMQLSPVYCRGPFSPTEITFLTGATLERKKLKPRYAAGIAEENLEVLRQEPGRRHREPVTGTHEQRFPK